MSRESNESRRNHLPGEKPQFTLVSHSGLVYWWPVWSLGFVMAAIPFASGSRLAIVPEGSKIAPIVSGQGPTVFELT